MLKAEPLTAQQGGLCTCKHCILSTFPEFCEKNNHRHITRVWFEPTTPCISISTLEYTMLNTHWCMGKKTKLISFIPDANLTSSVIKLFCVVSIGKDFCILPPPFHSFLTNKMKNNNTSHFIWLSKLDTILVSNGYSGEGRIQTISSGQNSVSWHHFCFCIAPCVIKSSTFLLNLSMIPFSLFGLVKIN